MRLRIKFRKYGPVRFIGHLDVMRFFQKAIRRAGIDVAYSGGFSPHQIMSFAAPLGVGLTSEGEYVDLQVNSCTSSKAAVAAFQKCLEDGGITATVRRSLGGDIDASCGQLRPKYTKQQ